MSEAPKPSTTLATIGRVVYVFCPTRWKGPRRADVTGLTQETPPTTPEGEPHAPLVNVCVTLDLEHDAELIRRSVPAVGRQGSGSGFLRHFSHLRIFDPLTPPDRLKVEPSSTDHGDTVWEEWMPFQKGQAARTDNAERELLERLSTLEARLEATEITIGEWTEGSGED